MNDSNDEQLRTLWVGGAIGPKVDDELLYELFVNAGPLEGVKIPMDRERNQPKNYAFIIFQHKESVPYAYELFKDTKLFGRTLILQNRETGIGLSNNGRSFNRSNSSPNFSNDRSRDSSKSNYNNSNASTPQPLMNGNVQPPQFLPPPPGYSGSPVFAANNYDNRSRRDHEHRGNRRRNDFSHDDRQYNNDHQNNYNHSRSSSASNDRRDRSHDRRDDRYNNSGNYYDSRRNSYRDRSNDRRR